MPSAIVPPSSSSATASASRWAPRWCWSSSPRPPSASSRPTAHGASRRAPRRWPTRSRASATPRCPKCDARTCCANTSCLRSTAPPNRANRSRPMRCWRWPAMPSCWVNSAIRRCAARWRWPNWRCSAATSRTAFAAAAGQRRYLLRPARAPFHARRRASCPPRGAPVRIGRARRAGSPQRLADAPARGAGTRPFRPLRPLP